MKKLYPCCPTCGQGRLIHTKYEAPLKLLKDREWLYCKNCNYEIQLDEFKKLLCCA